MEITCTLCGVNEPSALQWISIPLREDWSRVSGVYCSMKCALEDNCTQNRGTRTVYNWEQREKWLMNGSPSKELSVQGKRRY